jgi:hypothetical protein
VTPAGKKHISKAGRGNISLGLDRILTEWLELQPARAASRS